MMIEFEDHGEEEQQLLLRYLDRAKAQDRAGAGAPPPPPKPGWFWRLIGRIWLAYVRWRYGGPR
jgi:hypothetical protein